MKVIYPAIIREINHDQFFAEFPDLPECTVEATSLNQCLKEAEYMLGAYICTLAENNMSIPDPSQLTDIEVPEDGYATYIEADPIYHSNAYKQKKHKAHKLKITLYCVTLATLTAATGALIGYSYYRKNKK